MNSEIYRSIIEASPPLTLQPPLHRVQQTSVRRGADDAAQLRQALELKFPREALLAAGVVRTQPDGGPELLLHPDLADPQRAFLSLSANGEAGPFELIGASGCMSGGRLPLLAALQDHGLRSRLKASPTLLLALDVADCAALSAFHFPATVATGLDQLAGAELSAVCQQLGWRRGLSPEPKSSADGAADAAESSRPQTLRPLTLDRIVLVGWSPSTWSSQRPAAYLPIRGHLERLHFDLQIQMPQVFSWTPEPNSLQSIAFVAAHGNRTELRQALLNSILRESQPLIETPVQEESLATAFQAMWASAADPRDSAEAQEKFLRLLRERVITPLLQESPANSPADQLRSSLLAINAETFYLKAVPTQMELARQSPRDRSWTSSPGIGIDVKPILEMSRELLKLLPAPGRRPRRR